MDERNHYDFAEPFDVRRKRQRRLRLLLLIGGLAVLAVGLAGWWMAAG